MTPIEKTLQARIKQLELDLKTLKGSLFLVEEVTRKGTQSTIKVMRDDTKEVMEDIESNVANVVNETGKGFVIVQNNVASYIEQLNFFKEFSDLLEKMKSFFDLQFSASIPQNSPPPWGMQAELISQEIQQFIEKLKKVLP